MKRKKGNFCPPVFGSEKNHLVIVRGRELRVAVERHRGTDVIEQGRAATATTETSPTEFIPPREKAYSFDPFDRISGPECDSLRNPLATSPTNWWISSFSCSSITTGTTFFPQPDRPIALALAQDVRIKSNLVDSIGTINEGRMENPFAVYLFR
ncbi:dTDP-4-dehydrorhamnose 3,5-epimerase [Anopheles sinensis]|uniref:dTDP-4-dehydrorhamnose 3,5-epimerase n=1 Tax=Anopheles sinensis TaxID=74873 RepID=A0A084WAX7_ANOSI|nr:dTDP-4-dehydrorhamnose 3,5-epimerase [Anopheles sinensis]